jgi:glycosyltransferase involved in cell wall biosynthesis
VYQLNLITLRMKNHAKPSGYDRLADHMKCRVFAPPVEWRFFQRLTAKSLNWLTQRSGVRWYHREAMYNETTAAWQWLRKPHQVFHFIYGENSYRYLAWMKRARAKNVVIATYHTPPGKFRQLIPDPRFLRQLDAVVVVSRSQQAFFSGLIGADRVFFVPHGVDVHYFRPGEPNSGSHKKDRNFQCLFVGKHLRDFDVLSETVKTLAIRDPNIQFQGVIPDELKDHFRGLPNVTLMTGISDERLLQLYQQADLLVLPLIDGTANNSILEAMACGLPVVSTDLPCTRDYIDDSSASLVPKGDVRAVVEAIEALKKDQNKRKGFAKAIRNRAMDLSWEKTALHMEKVYQAVTGIHPAFG